MSIRVSAVQLAFSFAYKPQDFFDHVRAPIERAAEQGAQIVALPDYTGLMLLGVSTPVSQTALLLGEIAQARQFDTIGGMLLAAVPSMNEFCLHLFSSLAARYHVYLAPGTTVESAGDKLYNTAFLFGPDGSLIGSQRQTHRTARELGWGLEQGADLSVFDIGIARVGFVVGADVEHPEIARLLALQNADLLIHPAAYPLWHEEHRLFDLCRDCQSNPVIGLQACLVGPEFKGKSSIYSPLELTDDHRGIIREAASPDDEAVVTADVDLDSVRSFKDRHPVFGAFNYDFYAQEFPGVYWGRPA